MPFLLRSAALITLLPALLHADTPLELEAFDGPVPAFHEALPGTVEIHGAMPVRATPRSAPAADDLVLEMEYFCAGGVPDFAVLPGPPFEAKTARRLPAIGHSETWSRYAARIAPAGKPLPSGWQQLRLDLPLPKDRVLQIRNARLRPAIPGEFDRAAARSQASANKDALERYLAAKFPALIERVSVKEEAIEITGHSGKESGELFLADIPMDLVLDSPQSWDELIPVKTGTGGRFTLTLPRLRQRAGLAYDRLSSRWQLVRKSSHGISPPLPRPLCGKRDRPLSRSARCRAEEQEGPRRLAPRPLARGTR